VSKRELNIFKLLSQKPWESSQAAIDNEHDGKTLGLSKTNLGVRTVMVVSTVIFSLFFLIEIFSIVLMGDFAPQDDALNVEKS